MGGGETTEPTARFVPPPGYTQIPNVLLDEVMADATGAEFKVTMAIARKTFGWGKEERLITNAELVELTGLSRQSVTAGVEAAVERGFIGKRHAKGNQWLYGLRVKKDDAGQFLTGQEIGQDSGSGGQVSSHPTTSTKQRSPTGSKKDSASGGDGVKKGGTKKRADRRDLFEADPESPVDAVILEVFEAWRVGTDAGAAHLTIARADNMRERLREAGRMCPEDSQEAKLAFAREEVLRAVKGMATSKWHIDNGQQDFMQLFRNRGRVEFFLKRLKTTQRDEGESAAQRFHAYDAVVQAQQHRPAA